MTLIELVFAMGILSVLAAGLYLLFARYLETFRTQEAVIERRQDLRLGTVLLTGELRRAGYGVLIQDAALLNFRPGCHPGYGSMPYRIGSDTIRFLANLYGIQTHLFQEARPGDAHLVIPGDAQIAAGGFSVSSGRSFAANDVLYLYRIDAASQRAIDVECHRLRSRGGDGRIPLDPVDPVRSAFPAGSPVHVVNEVEYLFDRAAGRLRRRIDGGVEVLMEGLADVRFEEHGRGIRVKLIPEVPLGIPLLAAGGVETAVEWRNPS